MACTSSSEPLFPPGRVVMTVGVDELIKTGRLNPYPYLFCHLRGDWGDLCDEDRRRNDAAVNSGERLFSEYKVSPSLTLWIITEADRSATTVLLPSEY
ncbi:Type I restriction-modification system methyltransferase subunit [Burkholderia pseudomallei]|uniref:hypothetical protein n=1 Tax=Burkholderia pseudomallei TaxID=28450 RepID=UPI0005DE1EB8|nr:hypothetical protein [Burkholderia pseudomallei]CAJ9899705.1 Type I restriction-modification system methyltransferase subunit [Burkholderia pseudomallei]CFL69291.1 Type I restriction-modification system methyltransferase subunit [Burkholderia pseudomallei]CPI59215.1 Type I restriction-modification system methyltransferase subunit [Burkholderia pseudomallei]